MLDFYGYVEIINDKRILKFDMAVVSCRLAIEKNDMLNIEFYLQECLFNNNCLKH